MIWRMVAVSLSLLFARGSALGAEFQFVPVRIELSSLARTALLKVSNHGKEELRLQLTAMAWSQDDHNPIALNPTSDVSIFPSLLKIRPGESRQIRMGTSTVAGALEKSYRIIARELPSVDRTPAEGIQVLTEMSIPVFFAPLNVEAGARIDSLGKQGNALSFALNNIGNVCLRLVEARIVGRGSEGKNVFEGKKTGWYVLPGASSSFDFELPTADCSGVKEIEVEAETDRGLFRAHFDPSSACRL